MRYSVKLSQTVIETVTIEIEADDRDAVERLAIRAAVEGDKPLEWQFEDVTDGAIEIVSVKEA